MDSRATLENSNVIIHHPRDVIVPRKLWILKDNYRQVEWRATLKPAASRPVFRPQKLSAIWKLEQKLKLSKCLSLSKKLHAIREEGRSVHLEDCCGT